MIWFRGFKIVITELRSAAFFEKEEKIYKGQDVGVVPFLIVHAAFSSKEKKKAFDLGKIV